MWACHPLSTHQTSCTWGNVCRTKNRRGHATSNYLLILTPYILRQCDPSQCHLHLLTWLLQQCQNGSPLKHEFDDAKTYSVTSEVSPDGSRRRVDVAVKRYDKHHHTMSALLWVECKRPGGSLREVEKQAVDAAKRCVHADNLSFIYTMNTVGVSFRMWFAKGAEGTLRGSDFGRQDSVRRDVDSQNAIYIRDIKTT